MDTNIFEIGAYGLIYVIPFVCLCGIPILILAIFLFFRKIHKDANTPEAKAKYAKQQEYYESRKQSPKEIADEQEAENRYWQWMLHDGDKYLEDQKEYLEKRRREREGDED